jgi:hypothetical protein
MTLSCVGTGFPYKNVMLCTNSEYFSLVISVPSYHSKREIPTKTKTFLHSKEFRYFAWDHL